MRHDPELSRLVHQVDCGCARCNFRAAFGRLAPLERPVLALGFLAAAIALVLVPGRYLLALVVPS